MRAGSHYGQTSRGEAFGPMKTHKCSKFILLAFTLEAELFLDTDNFNAFFQSKGFSS